MIVINDKAPDWAKDVVRKIEDEIQQALSQPVRLPMYTLATVPDARRFTNCSVIVTDGALGQTVATSDGVNWIAIGASGVPSTRTINTTAPITGGGDLSADRTIAHADTAVTIGSYGDSSHVASFTVDQKGHLTAASNVAISVAVDEGQLWFGAGIFTV